MTLEEAFDGVRNREARWKYLELCRELERSPTAIAMASIALEDIGKGQNDALISAMAVAYQAGKLAGEVEQREQYEMKSPGVIN